MTSANRSPRVRLDVTVPDELAASLRAYAREWHLSLSTLVESACDAFLWDASRRSDPRPLRVRMRSRRGPLSTLERSLSDEALRGRGSRGGRPLA